MSNTMIQRLEEERSSLLDFIDRTVSGADGEKRDLSKSEKETLQKTRERVQELDAQLVPLREFEELRTAHRSSGSPAPRPTNPTDAAGNLGAARTEAREYQYRSAGEFLADGYRAAIHNDDDAAHRLETHGVRVVQGALTRADAPHTTTTEVPGLLPKPIAGQVMSDVDAARPFVTSVGAKDLGGIPGKVFSRPTISQHVTVGEQSAEKAELEDGQFKVVGVDFTKRTFGGWTNVSRQAIDWTSPAAWDALMADFIEQYGLQTEEAAATDFETAVTAVEDVETAGAAATLPELVRGLYGAAVKAYQGSGRLPDTIWASLDWWPVLGELIDVLKATTAGNGGGSSQMDSFAGNLLGVNRVIVPSFAETTLIVGVKSRTEVYEDRIGFLSAVQPKVLGVELAYGGYMANGTIKPAAFAKVTTTPATP